MSKWESKKYPDYETTCFVWNGKRVFIASFLGMVDRLERGRRWVEGNGWVEELEGEEIVAWMPVEFPKPPTRKKGASA